MKIFVAITILFLFSAMHSIGQTRWGIKAGANVANTRLNKEYEEKFDTKAENRIGYQVGFMAQSKVSEAVFLRAEIYYAIKGYKYYRKDLDTEAKRAFNYIILPVFVGYNVTPELSVFLGPQIGFLGPAYHKNKNQERQNLRHIVNYNNIDAGVGAGIAYTLTPKIGVDIRYTHGFGVLLEEEITDGAMNYVSTLQEKNNKTLELSLNYFFRQKK